MPRMPEFPADDASSSAAKSRKRPRRAPHGRRRHDRAAKAKQPRSSRTRSHLAHPAVAATARAPLGATADPWHTPTASGVGPGALLDLTADAGLGNVVLELVGAERANLGSALGAWQREQDRLLNRAWRRPGGLARPAGL